MSPATVLINILVLIARREGFVVSFRRRVSQDCDGSISFDGSTGSNKKRSKRKRNHNLIIIRDDRKKDPIKVLTVLAHEIGHLDQYKKYRQFISLNKTQKRKLSKSLIDKHLGFGRHLTDTRYTNDPDEIKWIKLCEIDASKRALKMIRELTTLTNNESLYDKVAQRVNAKTSDEKKLLAELDKGEIKEWLRDSWIESYKIKKNI